MAFVGLILAAANLDSVLLVVGLLLFAAGVLLGRAVGSFLELDLKGILSFRIAGVTTALFFIGLSSGFRIAELQSFILSTTGIIVGIALVFGLSEIYIRHEIDRASA